MPSLPTQITLADLSKVTFDGNYSLLKPIGQGGYGTVYRAIEHPSGDTVAIKVVRTPKPGTYHAELLELEVEAITKMYVLPSLAPVRHIFEEDDFTFIVLNYIDGGDLDGYIMRDRLFVGDNERVRYVFNRMLIAVEDVHAYGYRHRDIKPGNFLVTKGLERVYLTDFGLCSKGNGPVKDSFGDTGRGTYTHLAPEGFTPDDVPVRIDAVKSDVYALATTLFQMLYGEYPWHQSTMEDPRYEFFVKSREEFFNWRDTYAIQQGEPGLSLDARTLLMDALNPNMDERLDLYEFDRRFSLIDDFFGPRVCSNRPSEPPSLESMSPFVISSESDESEEAPVTPEHALAPILEDIMEKIADIRELLACGRQLTVRNVADHDILSN